MAESYPIGTRAESERLVRDWGFDHVFTWSDRGNAYYPPHTHDDVTTHLIRRGTFTVKYPEDTAKGGARKETFETGARIDVPAGKLHEVPCRVMETSPKKLAPNHGFWCFLSPNVIIFGWTSNFKAMYWIIPIITSMFFSIGGYMILNFIFYYQSCISASCYRYISQSWYWVDLYVAGCLTVLFVLYMFVLFWCGRMMRLASKYTRLDI